VDHVDLVALLIAGQTDREGKGLGAVRRRQEVGIGAVHATDADDAIHDASERIGGWIPTGCEETVGAPVHADAGGGVPGGARVETGEASELVGADVGADERQPTDRAAIAPQSRPNSHGYRRARM